MIFDCEEVVTLSGDLVFVTTVQLGNNHHITFSGWDYFVFKFLSPNFIDKNFN